MPPWRNAYALVLETSALTGLGVQVSPGVPIRTYSPTAETAASNPVQWVFESPYVHHAVVVERIHGGT